MIEFLVLTVCFIPLAGFVNLVVDAWLKEEKWKQ
jgi:hypothetical protein